MLGYKALAVTVDTPVLGRRESDVRGGFVLPSHLTMGNFKAIKQAEGERIPCMITEHMTDYMDSLSYYMAYNSFHGYPTLLQSI
jgi:isopentenyl diphosphate isomerase/L-lactate dehydrogenase-like FMN-dependent dehydrogenase